MTSPRRPSLIAEPPLPQTTHTVTNSPFVIGRAREAGARVDHPQIQPRHAVLLEREDGWWLSGSSPTLRVNGLSPGGRDRLLVQGDHIELAPGAVLRFDDGTVVEAPKAPVGVNQWTPPRPRRKKRRWRMPEWHWSAPSRTTMLVALVVVITGSAFGGYLWWHNQSRPQVEPPPLSVAEAGVFDSLLSVAFDHIERGNVLLELGASQTALSEFATGLSVISTSSLRNNAYVQRRLDQLRASIGEVYRSRRITVPGTFAAGDPKQTLAGQGLAAALTVEQFANAMATVREEFMRRFQLTLEVTGRDHAEHRSLYGVGGALDVRSKTLSPVQVEFLVATARRTGIRVKDFSRDAVLQAQIQAAIKAGLADRAGTGRHLHLDRFANRRDRWTAP